MVAGHREARQTGVVSGLRSLGRSLARSLPGYSAPIRSGKLSSDTLGTVGATQPSVNSLAISWTATAADEKREGLSESQSRTLGVILSVLALWIRRSRSRRELIHIADHELRELRIYPADVKTETGKWFWQA